MKTKVTKTKTKTEVEVAAPEVAAPEVAAPTTAPAVAGAPTYSLNEKAQLLAAQGASAGPTLQRSAPGFGVAWRANGKTAPNTRAQALAAADPRLLAAVVATGSPAASAEEARVGAVGGVADSGTRRGAAQGHRDAGGVGARRWRDRRRLHLLDRGRLAQGDRPHDDRRHGQRDRAGRRAAQLHRRDLPRGHRLGRARRHRLAGGDRGDDQARMAHGFDVRVGQRDAVQETVAVLLELIGFDDAELRRRMDAVKFQFYDGLLGRVYGTPLADVPGRRQLAAGPR